MQKIIGFTSWVSSLETTPSPSIKAKKPSTSAPVNTMTPTPRTTETGTQVQVSTPKSKTKFTPIPMPPKPTTSTIETQTIENPELLAHNEEELVGHYTQEIFQLYMLVKSIIQKYQFIQLISFKKCYYYMMI